jgi:phosphogluconate dehydratase
VLDGDVIRLDAQAGTLQVLVDPQAWNARAPATMSPELQAANCRGMGRELFTNLRKHALQAEEGACTWL